MIIDNVAVYKNEILGSLAWKRDDIANSDWRIKLPPQVLDELEDLISFLRVNPTPVSYTHLRAHET